MAFRSTYWSCTKFADWIRSTFGEFTQPDAATSEEWSMWKRVNKTAHPVVFWVASEGLDMVQDALMFIPDMWDKARQYVVNRYLDKMHYVPTGLKPGEWHETDTRLLHGMFELLVDFVEIEKAWMLVVWDKKAWKEYGYPRWYSFRPIRWAKHRRNPAAGVAYLEWEMSLGNPTPGDENSYSPYQAEAAREIYALYDWWKNIRPNRPDPHDASGWSEFCDRRRAVDGDDDLLSFLNDKTDEEQEESSRILKDCNEIEEEYEREDEQMMIRMIKVRRSLWT